jgi:hypothetical protein
MNCTYCTVCRNFFISVINISKVSIDEKFSGLFIGEINEVSVSWRELSKLNIVPKETTGAVGKVQVGLEFICLGVANGNA